MPLKQLHLLEDPYNAFEWSTFLIPEQIDDLQKLSEDRHQQCCCLYYDLELSIRRIAMRAAGQDFEELIGEFGKCAEGVRGKVKEWALEYQRFGHYLGGTKMPYHL